MSDAGPGALRVWHGLRQCNRLVALAVGAGLAACAAIALVDIAGRSLLGHGIGGTDEISGYAMAILTSWGMSYALLELGHVRIELLRTRLRTRWQGLLDLLSMTSLAAVVSFIALRAWPVLERSWRNDSTANTPLETPLWWVQAPWLAGWVWFALSAWLMLLLGCYWLWRAEHEQLNRACGINAEGEASA